MLSCIVASLISATMQPVEAYTYRYDIETYRIRYVGVGNEISEAIFISRCSLLFRFQNTNNGFRNCF